MFDELLCLLFGIGTRSKGLSVEIQQHMGARTRCVQITADCDRLAERAKAQPRIAARALSAAKATAHHAYLALALVAVYGCTSRDDDTATASSTSGFTAKIHYHYDALGRLIQAASIDGTGVQYSYDAVGNITAVRRLDANALRVVDVAPPSGAIGSSVVVFGSGFNATAAQNTVSFNGTTATVTDANETALTVNVPAGATTGKITVANALGTATSPADFVVLGASLSPAITSFSPTVGTLDTVVSVSGSNFQTRVVDDKVTIGGLIAEIVQDASSPSTSLLKFRVPSTAASGKIEVTTPFGSVVSASEFFAVPTVVDPASVEFTGRIAVGGSPLTVTTTTAGKKIVLLFDGQAGQRLHVLTASGTFAAGALTDFYGPTGAKVQTLTLSNNNIVDFSAPLTAAGTYTVVMNPSASDKGSMQVSLVADVTGALALDGNTPVSLNGGQIASMSFAAQAGKGYGLALTALTFTPSGGSPSVTVTLRKADGTSLATTSFSTSGSCDFDPTSFATTGTYLLDFDPSGVSAASFGAVLSTDAGGTVTVDDTNPTSVTIARAGQNARYSFSGTANQVVTVVLSASTLDDGNSSTFSSTQVLVFKPSDGLSPIGSGTFNQAAGGLTLDLTLPETGNYVVAIKPSGLDSGSVNLQVKSFATGALTVDGSTALSLSAGQNGRFSFAAQAGKGYGLAVTGLVFTPSGGTPSMTVTLRKADGTALTTCSFNTIGSCDLEPTSFASAGTYYLDFDPSNLNTASFNAVLSTDTGGPVTVDAASPTAVTIARAGQNARYTFSGTAGQLVTVVVSGSTLDDGNSSTPSSTLVQVFKPSVNVSPIGNAAFNQVAAGLAMDLTLPVTGSYTVVIKPAGLDSGSVNLQVVSVATGTLSVNGSTPVNLAAGQNGRFSFAAQASTGYGLALTSLGFTPSTAIPQPSLAVALLKPDGTSVATCTFAASNSCDFAPAIFPVAGTYTLTFDPNGIVATTGNAVLSADATGSLTIDAAPTAISIARAGQNARYTFSGAAGQLVKVVVTGNTLDDGDASTTNSTQIAVFKPSSPAASPVNSFGLITGNANATLNLTLPETGTYTLTINPNGADSGSLTLGVAHQ